MISDKIVELKKDLVLYSDLIEEMITNSFEGLKNGDEKLLDKVINELESDANDREIEIDAKAIGVMALFQPEAKDLRTIVSIIKINNDLERIGDLTVNISESMLYLIRNEFVMKLKNISEIEKNVLQMYKKSIEAFINENSELAKTVLIEDKLVDNLEKKAIEFFIEFMKENTSLIEWTMNIIRIAHNLERIGDMCTNICEDVIFLKTGKVVKHKKND